jgi:hypothetical protein
MTDDALNAQSRVKQAKCKRWWKGSSGFRRSPIRVSRFLILFSHPPPVSTMASSQQPKGRDAALTTLNLLIQGLNVAKDACGIPPAQIAFGSASVLLTMIRVCLSLLCEEKLPAHVF